ncbi:MAG: methyltransferase domain-containing protein [Deltaproteobacteria bacterium]|nr:methyltransferase domain-containing protein [Deltaproteobacteria bacterium]
MLETTEVTWCEVCGGAGLISVLDLGSHPLCDDLVRVGDARLCREYPIEILFCERCATAHQRFQVPNRELFRKSYHYRSRFTADVLRGMEALVESCERQLGPLNGKLVLDIGCNDSSLLDVFARKGCRTIGIEPTGACADGLNRGHQLYNAFFTEESAEVILRDHGCPDIITFTNVFAHIENLPGVIRALKMLMSAKTVLVIENHYLGAILDRSQFDTFYHEHPRTYSVCSFLHIARSLESGVGAVEFPSRYGGNIRVFMGQRFPDRIGPAVAAALANEASFVQRFADLRANASSWRTIAGRRLVYLVAKHGPLSAKAFPGRAAILVKMLALDEASIAVVYEKPGSMKIGHYLPGTRIPIRSDEELFALATKPPIILNLAWHISGEIRQYLSEHRYRGEVVDILDPSDLPIDPASRRPPRTPLDLSGVDERSDLASPPSLSRR